VVNEQGFNWPMRPEYWDLLVPGTEVTIVKRRHDGKEVVFYPGRVVPTNAATPWVEIEATWTAGTIVQGPLTFETGDILREFFSWKHPYDAFAVYSPTHQFKGWYANVTYPSWVEHDGAELRLIWQDLWLDIVAGIGGEVDNLDDDELTASGLEQDKANLYRAIIQSREEILLELANRSGPFVSSYIPG
jgi:hypothetical protein